MVLRNLAHIVQGIARLSPVAVQMHGIHADGVGERGVKWQQVDRAINRFAKVHSRAALNGVAEHG